MSAMLEAVEAGAFFGGSGTLPTCAHSAEHCRIVQQALLFSLATVYEMTSEQTGFGMPGVHRENASLESMPGNLKTDYSLMRVSLKPGFSQSGR